MDDTNAAASRSPSQKIKKKKNRKNRKNKNKKNKRRKNTGGAVNNKQLVRAVRRADRTSVDYYGDDGDDDSRSRSRSVDPSTPVSLPLLGLGRHPLRIINQFSTARKSQSPPPPTVQSNPPPASSASSASASSSSTMNGGRLTPFVSVGPYCYTCICTLYLLMTMMMEHETITIIIIIKTKHFYPRIHLPPSYRMSQQQQQ